MPDLQERLTSALADRYAIEAEIGRGGMATVFLAEDLKHHRQVALKVLHAELTATLGAERFLHEIEIVAGLNHPHILPLHDSGEADGFLFYVMPYVEGDSLRQRLDRQHQLPIEECVSIARHVAEALESAHRQGVVHRDVKPANILLHQGSPLIADFGIAVAAGTAGGSRLTETGLSLGTPRYMSPEQAVGDQRVGPASDIYSIGCVLYEMLVGTPPRGGRTAQAVLADIITGGPVSPRAERSTVPANVDAAVRCALEKVPADRFTSAADFGAALSNSEYRFGNSETNRKAAAGRVTSVWKSPATWLVVFAFLAAGAAIRSLLGPPAEQPQPVIRYSLGFSEQQEPLPSPGKSIAVSRDGARIVYVGPAEGGTQLWVRDREQLRGRSIPGTVGAMNPFLSPDGSTIGFLSPDGALEVISMDDEKPLTLVESGVLRAGAAWSEDGYVYFDSDDPVGLTRVAATGGVAPEVIYGAEVGPGVLSHAWPDPLPNGRGVVLTVKRNHENDLVVVLDIETGEYRVLVEGLIGRYAESGHLVYVERDGSLLAAPFDAESMEITGPSVLLEELGEAFRADLALSATGRLIYTSRPAPIFEVVWVDRNGTETLLDPADPVRGIRFVSLSPDGSRLAMSTWTAPPKDDGQIWIKELPRGPLARFTFEGDVNFRPEWMSDGQSLTFISDRGENRDVWVKPADGSGEARLLLDDVAVIDEVHIPLDGQWLVYRLGTQDGERDIYAIRPGVDRSGTPLIDTSFDEVAPAVSPDGRWLAYTSDEGGQANIYVRFFPDADVQWRVSTNGGTGPIWTRGGKELMYANGADSMVVVEIDAAEEFEFGEEKVLFSTYPYRTDFFHQSYDVTADGQRFVMIRIDEAGRASDELIVVENWFEELREKVGR
jgi:serine/threonine protein kinase